MTGTVKQIEWANDLKARFKATMELFPGVMEREAEKTRPRWASHGDGEKFDAMAQGVVAHVRTRSREILDTKEASWWIDNAQDVNTALFYDRPVNRENQDVVFFDKCLYRLVKGILTRTI